MTSVALYSYPIPQTAAPDVTGPRWWGVFESSNSDDLVGYSQRVLSAAPRLLVSDVDSTLIEEEVIDELARLAGVGSDVAAITELAMQGHLDFASSLQRRVALLEGLPEAALTEVAESLHIRTGAQALIDWVHDAGGEVAVVSGGFTPVVEVLAHRLGIDHVRANGLEVRNHRLTGRVAGRIVTAETKVQVLRELASRLGGPTLAIGDGANDIPMLQSADLGVAVMSKPIVKKTIGNYLDVPDLSAVAGLAGFSVQ